MASLPGKLLVHPLRGDWFASHSDATPPHRQKALHEYDPSCCIDRSLAATLSSHQHSLSCKVFIATSAAFRGSSIS
eukprot:3237094-Amphidinium_carterae.1